MPVRGRKRHVRLGIHGQRGRNVQEDRLEDPSRTVDAQPVRDARAPVVRADVEFVEAEPGHGGGAVGRHGFLAVFRVVAAAGGLGGFAVAAEVEEDEGVGAG